MFFLAQGAFPQVQSLHKTPNFRSWQRYRKRRAICNLFARSHLRLFDFFRHAVCINEAMTRIVEALLEAQSVRLQNKAPTPEQEKQLEWIRLNVPAPVLLKFERFVVRGKKAVATVRHGVCGECHLRLASGALAGLAYTTELHHCDNCGRLLYLPADEPLGLTAAPVEKTSAKKSKARAAVAAS
jgi:hypothetical protein